MEGLAITFRAKLAVTKEMDAETTPADIGAFMRSLTAEIGGLIRNVNVSLQRTLRVKFAEFGWNAATNRSTSVSPPTLAQLLAFLTGCVAAVEGFRPPVDPTAAELADPSMAANRLWSLDVNRLTPGVEYAIDLQESKKSYEPGDAAPGPLFERVSVEVFDRPTYSAFMHLLDNYESHVGTKEQLTTAELHENSRFLDACLQTPCLQYTHKYLVTKGKAPASVAAFKTMLHEAWFDMYSRDHGSLDSSGFEHVFVGESKLGKISGLHNWLQIYKEEKQGRLDYKGYIRARGQRSGSAPPAASQLVTIQFAWDGELKDVSSSLIGVSPEFEIALYSLLFFLGQEKTVVQLGPYTAEITTFQFRQRGKVYIGTSFPGEAPFGTAQAATRIQAVQRGRQVRSGRGE